MSGSRDPRPVPPALRAGDIVDLVAPAGPVEADRLDEVAALFRRHGLVPRFGDACRDRRDFLAGEDDRRAADLQRALDAPDSAAVWCLRGGTGCTRLLPRLDLAGLRRRPKLLIGYSDVTALHAALDRAGLASLHAPMPSSDLLRPEGADDAQAVFALVAAPVAAGRTWQARPAGTPHRPGIAEGRLVGGNLAVLAALAGTPWQPDTRGTVLFLEDVNEEPYRVDRLLVQLDQCGLLDGCAGFLLGSFTGADDASAVLAEHLASRGRPLLAGWPAGHGTPNRPLPLGVKVRLDTGAGRLTLLEPFLA